jgi:Nuclear transport factor 2 (NTF2) domain
MSFDQVGKQFVEHYYNTFDTNRANLGALYQGQSMLTYEGEQFLGAQAIMDKLFALPSVRHNILTFDAQPSFNNGILCFVSGDLIIDGNVSQPMKFSQCFHLAVGGNLGYYCHNDMFRLNYG